MILKRRTARGAPWRLLLGGALLSLGCLTEGRPILEEEEDAIVDASARDARVLGDGALKDGDVVLPPRCYAECCSVIHVGPPEYETCLDPQEDEEFRWAIQNLGWESGLYPSCCPSDVTGPYVPQEEGALCAYLIEGEICER